MTVDSEGSKPGATQRRALRVLCADDDHHVAGMLKCALELAGHHVEHAEDGSIALRRLTEQDSAIDLLVTDHEMPTLSGLKLVRRLRELEFAGKIVVHSSELQPKDRAEYEALSVDYIFTKPARLDEFLAVVHRLGGSGK